MVQTGTGAYQREASADCSSSAEDASHRREEESDEDRGSASNNTTWSFSQVLGNLFPQLSLENFAQVILRSFDISTGYHKSETYRSWYTIQLAIIIRFDVKANPTYP